MNVNKVIYSSLVILIIAAGVMYFLKESARKEYEQTKAEYDALPEMPVDVTYRSSLLNSGLVAIFNNKSNRQLSLLVTVSNPTLGNESTFQLDLAPQAVREVGHMEGWAFASGDLIKIVHNDYKPQLTEMP